MFDLGTLGSAQPKYATKQDPSLPNELASVEALAKVLRIELLPWQRLFVSVATQYYPDTGAYRYPFVGLTVPRRAGKTTIIGLIQLARCIRKPQRRSWLTAQSGKDAKERIFDLADKVLVSPLGGKAKVRRAAESPRIELPNNSRYQAFPPTPESLHGYNVFDVAADEIFSFTEDQGDLLLGALTPAMSTVIDRQFFWLSTMGTSESIWMNGQVAKGRESVNDPESTMAYFEWSMEDGLDPNDDESFGFHPGLQGGLIQISDIQQARETLSPGEFIRAYANVITANENPLFDWESFSKATAQQSKPERRDIAIGWEVTADRSRAAVVAAWRDQGKVSLKLLRNGSNPSSWLPEALEEINDARPLALGADRYPQNLAMLREVEELDTEFTEEHHLLTPEQAKTGATLLKNYIEDGKLQHNGHDALINAVRTAVSRRMGEGWVLSHNSEPEVLAAMTAIQLLHENRPQAKPMSVIL